MAGIKAPPITFPGDLLVKGEVYAEDGVRLKDGTVESRHIANGANLEAVKLEHQHQPAYAQPVASTAIAEGKVIHVCRAAGELIDVYFGLTVANVGDSTVTFDLKVNGTSILDAPLVISSATTAYDVVAGVLDVAPTPLAVGDVVSVVVAIAAGTGTLGKGPFAQACIREPAGT